MNVSEVVTNTIIKKLEEGHIPWIKPWDYVDAVNYVSQKPYAGINKLLLDGGEYLTFKQIKDNGGNIKPGSKAKIVVFYKPWDIEDKETGEVVHTRVMRYYNVFSIADVEGIESKQPELQHKNYNINECEQIVNNYLDKSGVGFETKICNRAYYVPSEDRVCVPYINQFKNSQSYYGTVFHELAHSTGHESRLDRLKSTAHFGNDEYSREELVAEISSAMLCNHVGIDSKELLDNSTAYVESWIKALKNDKNMIITAAAKAQKAYDYILA